MDRRLIPALTLVAGLAIGGGVAFWLRPSEPPVAPKIESSTGGGRLGIALEEPPENPGNQPKMPPKGLLPPEAQSHPEYFEDLGEERPDEPPEALPAEIEYRRLDKLAVDSEVPHRTLGAWDEDPESATPGARRAFVMVVDPKTSDADLEALARDLRAQNRDARILNVRIFDSEEGARRAGWVDGGALSYQHLVAQVSRNEALGLDAIRVRGRLIEP